MDQQVLEKLHLFGLNDFQAKIYTSLLKKGWCTVLQLSRLLQVKRTNLYRILDNMVDQGLLETLVDDKTTYYGASTIEAFENMISRHEKQLKTMHQAADWLATWVKTIQTEASHSTSVKIYKGVTGLSYLEWQKCETPNSEICILDSNQWHQKLSQEFAENIRTAVVKNNIHIREICNPEYVFPINPDGTTSWTKNNTYLKNHYRYKSIPKETLDIKQDIYIFTDHIQFQGYQDDELVGIDIHSPIYAQMFLQIFNILWNLTV